MEKCGCGADMPFDYGLFLPSHLMYGKLCLACLESLGPYLPKIMGVKPAAIPPAPEVVEARKAVLSKNLEKARAVRSMTAKEKKIHKQEIKEMKRAQNPEEYERIYQIRLANVAKARAAREAKKAESIEKQSA